MSLSQVVLFFCLVGAVQGTLLGVSLITTPHDDRRARLVLALFMLGGALCMAVISLSHSEWVTWQPLLEAIEYTTIFSVAPLLLLYVRVASRPEEPIPAWFWLHFVPAALWLGYLILWSSNDLTVMNVSSFEALSEIINSKSLKLCERTL